MSAPRAAAYAGSLGGSLTFELIRTLRFRHLSIVVLLACTAFRDVHAQRSTKPLFLPSGWPAHQWPYVGPWQLTVWRDLGAPAISIPITIAPDSLERAGNELILGICHTCLAIELPGHLWDSLRLRQALTTTWEFEISPAGHLLGLAPGRHIYSAGALEFEGYWDGDSLRGFWHEYRPRHHRYGRFVLVPRGPRPPSPAPPSAFWVGSPILELAPTDARFQALADSLRRLDPRSELQAALARGERRALALQTQIPGILVDHYPYVRERLGTLLLPWTSTFAAGSAHQEWQKTAEIYARRYNRLLWAAAGGR